MDYQNRSIASQIGAPAPIDPYGAHAGAVQEWKESCLDLDRAQTRNMNAQKALEEATQRLGQVMEAGLQNPTVPQPKCATEPPGYGLAGQMLRNG